MVLNSDGRDFSIHLRSICQTVSDLLSKNNSQCKNNLSQVTVLHSNSF